MKRSVHHPSIQDRTVVNRRVVNRTVVNRTVLTSVIAAGVLLVAGCSSSDSGGTSTAAATTTTSAASSMAQDSTAASDETSAGTSAGTGDATALDAQSTAWFETLCNGVAPVAELAQTADTSGLSDAAAQQKGVELITEFGAALSDTGTALADAPPPTFEGGEEFAATMTSGLTESGAQMATLAQSFGAIDPTDTAALKAAVTSLSDDLSTAVAPLSAIGDLDPAISDAAQQIPACAALG